MPRYKLPNGIVVDISEEKAARIDGLTPADDAPPAPRKTTAGKKAAPAKPPGKP